jgi:hypothetical protein
MAPSRATTPNEYEMGRARPLTLAADEVSKPDDEPALEPFEPDEEFKGLIVYERKALLINRELDSHGMGRYQWWIWSLCSFGWVELRLMISH